MKPTVLKGHERSLTFVKYNAGGDLLVTCSKDHAPNIWFTDDGSRLGTFDGHRGTVWNCDITDDSKYLLTASADQFTKLWSTQTGKVLCDYNIGGPARWVALSEGCGEFLVVHDNFKEAAGGVPCGIALYKLDLEEATGVGGAAEGEEAEGPQPYLRITVSENPRARITAAMWLPLNDRILVAMEQGGLKVFDSQTGAQITEMEAHTGHTITSLVFSYDKTCFLTTSSDATTTLWDTKELRALKSYKGEARINSASLHPTRELLLMGGGQEARDVTTTAAGAGNFEARIHSVTQGDLLGTLQGHFGPINTCAWNPDGLSFTTGGEDGYVRLHNLKDDWGVWGSLGEEGALDDPAVTAKVEADWDLAEEEKEYAEEGEYEEEEYDEEGAPEHAGGAAS